MERPLGEGRCPNSVSESDGQDGYGSNEGEGERGDEGRCGVGGGGACFAANSAANEPSRNSGAGGGCECSHSNSGGAKLLPPSV